MMPPEYNFVNSFVIHVFNFESEETTWWFLFRIIYSLVVLADATISVGACVLYSIMGTLFIHIHTSWLSHLERATCSMHSVKIFFHFYNILRIFNIRCQLVFNFVIVFTVGSSFIVSIICNVIALSMFHKMDTLIYFICVSYGCIFLTVTMTLLKFAAEIVDHSTSCVRKCKNVIFGRQAKRARKNMKSLRLIGLAMGGFYLISMDMLLIYGYHLLDKTISALLVIWVF